MKLKLIKSALFVLAFMNLTLQVTAQSNASLPSTTLWKISKDRGTKPSYLLLNATICNPESILSNKVSSLVDSVNSIYTENNLNSKQNGKKVHALISTQNDALRIKNILLPKSYAQLAAIGKEYGISEQILNQIKPFYIYSLIMKNANPCSNDGTQMGAEIGLEDLAKKSNKAYGELFSPEETISEMDAYPKEYWQQLISFLIENSEQVKKAQQSKNAFYSSANLGALQNLIANDPYLKLKYNLNNDQHNEMLFSRIDLIIKSGPALITTDALWALKGGQKSLFALLQAAGYTISPVL